MDSINRVEELEKQVQELKAQLIQEQKQVVIHAPKMGQKYWYIASDGGIYHSEWDDHQVDHDRLAFGNVYLTEEAAEKARDQKLAEVKVITRLRELDEGFIADWRDRKQDKHSVYFSYTENKFFTERCQLCQVLPSHWLSTRKAWNQVIQEIPEDIKTMMGVEV